MIFCDTHAHLYLEEFDADRDAATERAKAAGVKYILLPNIDRTSIHSMLALDSGCKMQDAGLSNPESIHDRQADEIRYSESCIEHPTSIIHHPASGIRHPVSFFPMIGLHPTSVKSDWEEELEIVEEYLAAPEHCFCAVGEIGIDLYWDKTFEKEQREAFSRQLDLAGKYNLPVAVHTRNSFDLTANVIESKMNPELKGVFHCFGGNLAQAQRAISLGFLLGIGGVITYKNSGLQQVVAAVGMQHLVLETDAPFLPPVPHRGERNEPAYIPLIAQKIAEILQVPVEEVAAITTENAVKLFNLTP